MRRVAWVRLNSIAILPGITRIQGACLQHVKDRAQRFHRQPGVELKDTPIRVNSAGHGYTATNMNDHRGNKTVAEGAAIILHLSDLTRRWINRRLL